MVSMQLKIAPNVLMRDARDRYLAANDLSMEEYTASTCTIGLCGIRLKLPNTKARQRAVSLHDLLGNGETKPSAV